MLTVVKKNINDIYPYENNPRDNTAAIKEVKESIRQCGYISPIVIDEDGVILAGHTRHQALMEMGEEEVACVIAEGLTEEQKRKFRLLDNKVGEIATWDINKLKKELEGLDFEDYEGFKALAEKIETEKYTDVVDEEPTEIYCPKCGSLVDAN